MLYVASARVAYVGGGLGLFLVGAVGVWRVTPHVQDRVTIWLHPWTERKVYCPLSGELDLRQNCQSFQLVKSLYSIGNGGDGGTRLPKGAGANLHRKQRTPHPTTHSLYSPPPRE